MRNGRRFTFTGAGPVKGDSRYGVETGELTAGDTVVAWPVEPDHPGFMWRCVNERNGYSMLCPPHDLKEM